MKKILLLFGILLASVILHEFIHLLQILFIDSIIYAGWGIGILEGHRPYGFYWIVDYPNSTKIYEVQAYGIQFLFLIGVLLNQRMKKDRRQKCASC